VLQLTSLSGLPAPRTKRQRPHLARLSALIPSSWTHRKVQVITVSPPDTPLRSLLIASSTDVTEDKGTRLTPTFIEPSRLPERRFPPVPTPTSARSGAGYHPRSASSCYPYTPSSLDDREELLTPSSTLVPEVSVDFVPHRRSASSPGVPSAAPKTPCGIWLCSPPTGKRAERPHCVRSSSTRSNEGRANAVDCAAALPTGQNAETTAQDCMSLHRAVTALSMPAEPSPRRSLDGDIAAGIYRFEVETPARMTAPVSAPPSRRYPGLGLHPPRSAPLLYAH
jgi:hypothetical protein